MSKSTIQSRGNELCPNNLELRRVFPGKRSEGSDRIHHFWGEATGLGRLLIEGGILYSLGLL